MGSILDRNSTSLLEALCSTSLQALFRSRILPVSPSTVEALFRCSLVEVEDPSSSGQVDVP